MLSEFRQDLVSGDWVLFATDRAKKPGMSGSKKDKFYQSKETCPFDNPQASGNGNPLLAYLDGRKVSWEGDFSGDWTTQVINNKFPALKNGLCGPLKKFGPFNVADANGFHELVITRDHDRHFAHFSNEETSEILMAYKERYTEISKDQCGDYIQIFHNHGPSAAASIYHNHSQIISMPVIPPEVMGSIRGTMNFYNSNKRKVHDLLISWEAKEKKRVIYENDKYISFCPYVSKTPYEIRIFPKKSSPCFHLINDEDIHSLADVLNTILKKIYKALDDIDYNFYIHTAPVAGDTAINYEFYHWHVEILPRASKIGALELGTDVYINVIDPDQAAELFRNTKT